MAVQTRGDRGHDRDRGICQFCYCGRAGGGGHGPTVGRGRREGGAISLINTPILLSQNVPSEFGPRVLEPNLQTNPSAAFTFLFVN